MRVSQEHVALGRGDVNHAIPPDIRAVAADAANAIAAPDRPGLDRVLPNLVERDRAQAEPQRTNLDAGTREPVLKSIPGKSKAAHKHDAESNRAELHWHQRHHQEQSN